MAITELVFPQVKDSEEARAAFFTDLRDSMRTTFGVPGGPVTFSLARVLESTPADAENHTGFMGVVTWDSLEKITNFLATPGFANFKSSLVKVSDGPPVLQFFEVGPDVAPEKTIRGATHFFVVKATGGEAQVDRAKKLWDGVAGAFSTVAGDQVRHHGGDGLQNFEGQFAGFSGWTSVAALNDALGNGKVQEELQSLFESGASISTFTLEPQHVV